MKVLELFGGIGACTKALKRLGLNPTTVDYVEIDKYAVASYNAINGTNFESQDICEWDKDIEVDLIMHGSPCQDFSIAGIQAGGDENSGTRSSLMYESIRIIQKLMPKYVVWENVKNVLSAKHKHNFDKYLNTLEELGYQNFYQVLNAKDYGIPQNRERVFVISILSGGEFNFPEKQELKLRLKDILQDDVDEKFYLSAEMTERVQKTLKNKDALMLDLCQWRREGSPREYNETAPTLSARDYKEPRCVQVGQMYGTEREPNPQAGRIYDSDGLSPTLDSCSGGNRMPKVTIDKLFDIPKEILNDNERQRRVYSDGGLSPSLLNRTDSPKVAIQKIDIPQTVKVRKYEVDTVKLVNTLREHKILTNKQIAEHLNVPITKVEHWFRIDGSFAIPDPEIWFKLKDLLGIKTDEFDESIMTFEEREGVYEKSNRCYHENGLAPTITSVSAVGEINFGSQYRQGNRIYDSEKIAMALMSQPVGNAGGNSYLYSVKTRIRKLTPLECWRLMGFDDEDFYKAETVNSNTQLYKQAGNSIVVNVLEAIFNQLLMRGETNE